MAKRQNLIPTKLETISENKNSFIEDIFLKTWHPYIWIASLGFLLYFQAILFDFADFDDKDLILGNSHYFLRNLSNIFEAFKQDVWKSHVQSYYRPLHIVSFMLDAQISGLGPWMYHLSNIIIHIIASSLLFAFLRQLKYSKKLSLFFSLVFTVHPVLTQAVCWIPGRNDSQLAVFILASFIFLLSFIEKKKWLYYGLHILFSALVLFTKESGVVIIPMLLVYLLVIAREKILSPNIKVLVLGWTMVVTSWLLARHAAFHNPMPLNISEMVNALWIGLPATFIFLGKILFPFNLSVIPTLKDSTFVFGYLTLILLAIGLILTRKIRVNFVIFGALWFMLFLSITFLTAKISNLAYFLEFRTYLPLIGFIIIVLETGLIKKMESKRGYLLPIGAIVVIGLSILTFSHSKVYKDKWHCWESAVDTSPHSYFAHNNLGGVFYDDGMRLMDIADQEYSSELQDNPAAKPNLNSGYYPEVIRLINKAEAEFRKALELNPAEKTAHNNLGAIYKLKKMYQEAEEEFRKALEIDPAYDEAFYKLGMVYADRYLIKKTEAKLLAEKGNLAESEKKLKGAGELLMEAEKYWSRTFQLKPDSIDEYKTLLIFYLGEMDFLKAFKYFVELKKRNVSISPSLEKWATVYQTNPDSIDCYQILLEYFLAEGHYLDFAAKYARVLEQKGITLSDETKKKLNLACDIPLSDVPDEIKKQLNLGRDNKQPSGEYSAEGSRILGDVFMSCGKYKEAIEEYKKAINVKPDYAEAYYGLGNAYEDAGMHKEAIEEYKKAINVKPDYAEAYCYSGVVYGKLGLYEDAIESFKQAIKVKPDYADAYCNLGVAYGKSGKHQEAIEPFKQAIKVKPDFAEAHYGLTLAYLRTDNKSSAITHYEILKKLDAKLAKELFKYFD